VRKITKALTVVSLLAPVSAYSLGIGDIRVRSALNQNLIAEIPLIVSKGDNPDSIKVSLAPADKFDEAGVSWSYFLSKIRFTTVVRPNGSVIVKVTSREALKEPYLNFLVEVTWPKGTLFREFTVLVDPPAEYQEPAYPVAPTYESYPSAQEDYVPRKPRAARPAVARSRRSAVAHFGGQVVTRRNDTLWKVAERARGGGVSVEQMMLAIYEKNPHAFYQPNVNALAAGKAIKIPEKDEAQRLSRQEALAEFDRQNDAWRNHTVPAASETQVAQQEAVESQLKLEAPAEGSVGSGESVTPSAEQSASSKSSGSAQTGKQATPPAAAVDPALQSKVDALEEQIKKMQELIALKDKQLAQMQNPSATPSQPPAPEQTPPVETTPPPTVMPPKAEQPVPPPVTPQPPAEVKPTPPPVAEVKPLPPPTPPKTVIKPKPPAAAPEESDSNIFWAAGGLATTLLGLFAWLWWRKQKVLKETDAESMFKNYSVTRGKDMSSGLSMIKSGEEGSFLNEFKSSDFETFESFNVDHGDIDPVAEADVYLAYGRYQQAEELIRQAIKDHPDRDECKLKLLEIFRANSNQQDFEQYANELVAAGKRSDSVFWDKVVEMAKDVCPDLAIFTGSPTAAVFDPNAGEQVESVLLTNDITPITLDNALGAASFNLPEADATESSFALEAGEPKSTAELKDDNSKKPEPTGDLDFGEDFGTGFEDRIEEIKDEDALDFDLGLSGSTASNEIESIAFDFDSVKVDSDKPAAIEKAELKDSWDPGQTLDFKFESVDDKQIEDNQPLEFNFDLDMPVDSAENIAVHADDFMVSDLTDMDELETKLDLAKAYIDMGDSDAAKEIIEQVMEEGSDAQKQVAKKLMEEII
jgi:pilus assembly protein FimV